MTVDAAENLSSIPRTAEASGLPHGRIPVAFGRRFFLGLVAGLAWLVPAWWSPTFILAMFFWDVLLLAMCLWDYFHLPPQSGISLSRIWSMRPALGVISQVSIQISTTGTRVLFAQVVDEMPSSLADTPPQFSATIPAAGSVLLSYSILPKQRGTVRIGRSFLRYQSGLQLAERRAFFETSQLVRILPNVEQARIQTLALIRSRQVEIERRRYRQRGMGRELDSLREYQPGDEVRDISWTATARRHRLITRVFQMERSQIIWLVLDAGRLLRAHIQEPGNSLRLSKLDHAVNAAFSLAQVAMHCGDRVGLLAYGSRVQQNLIPARGAHHLRLLADVLAEVHTENNEPDHAHAARTLLGVQKRRSLIVWITDFAETATIPEVIEYAMQMTPRHLVIFAAMSQPELSALASAVPSSVDNMYRHVAALEISQRREGLLRRLRQRGVLAFEWMPWGLSTFLVNQYLEVKERNWL
jgi:uncharacterized protein (DUF58 family)